MRTGERRALIGDDALNGLDDGTSLVDRFRSVRLTTARLAAPLSPEDCQVQSMPEASPTKWHLAHTTWFFETFLLIAHVRDYEPFHPAYRFLFNSYYNAVGPRAARPERGLMTRPSLAEVHDYRGAVDRAVAALIARSGDALPSAVAAIIELGLNHEQQHQELILTDIKSALARNPIRPAYRQDAARSGDADSPPIDWRAFCGGLDWIGHEGGGFCFDIERPRHRVYLEGFELASRPVTNGEYLAFMADGGYHRPELWLSEGWNVANARGWSAPLYWEEIDGSWSAMTLGGFRRVAVAEPVCHVSYFEADAYSRWAGARLPTEAEWEIAARSEGRRGTFLDDESFHPTPAGPSTGLAQCFGDVWEWTQSPYTPYPGMRPAAGALGEYNAKFACNQYVLRGGSCATPASHIRATYRNFFPPEARWQFSGFRLARD